MDFNIFHIGGSGGVGYTNRLLPMGNIKGNNVNLIVFEANLETEEFKIDEEDNSIVIKSFKDRFGINTKIFPYCMSDHVGVEKFYINELPDCSSLFKISKRAINQVMKHRRIKVIWKNDCKVNKIIDVNVTSFNKLFEDGFDIKPDFLSIDAQGSEYSILKGSTCFLKEDLIGIITEVEFRELYEGQPLFSDQDSLLRKYDFCFFNFVYSQQWYSHYIMGKGTLSVGEVLFLRDYIYFVNKYNTNLEKMFECLSKLILVANTYQFISYSYEIILYLIEKFGDEWSDFIKKSESESIKLINDFYISLEKDISEGKYL